MTIYATDLDQVLATIRSTLTDKVLPGLTDESAARELAAVLEQLDNLSGRLSWSPAALQHSIERTEELAVRLGVTAPAPEGGGVAALRTRRGQIADQLRNAFGDPAGARDTVDAVLSFTTADIRDQISVGLRGSLPE